MKNFQDPKQLVQTLTIAWEKMTKLRVHSLGAEVTLQEEARSMKILTTVNEWNAQKNQNFCELHLKQLAQQKLQIAKRSITPQAWPVFYLSKPPIQNYLKWVTKVTEHRSGKITEGKSQESIRLLMQQLVDPSDLNIVENFPDKHCISKWLYQSEQIEVILPLECKDFLNLQIFFKQALEDLYLAQTSGSGKAQQQAKICATVHVTMLSTTYVIISSKQTKNMKIYSLLPFCTPLGMMLVKRSSYTYSQLMT